MKAGDKIVLIVTITPEMRLWARVKLPQNGEVCTCKWIKGDDIGIKGYPADTNWEWRTSVWKKVEDNFTNALTQELAYKQKYEDDQLAKEQKRELKPVFTTDAEF